MSDYWGKILDDANSKTSKSSSKSTSSKATSSPKSSGSSDYWGNVLNDAEKKRKKKKKYTDDIAPTRSNVNSRLNERSTVSSRVKSRANAGKAEKEQKWFEKGLFEDGYDFGDVSKTILGTAADVVEDLGAGIAEMPEKIADATAMIAPYYAQSQLNQAAYNTMNADLLKTAKEYDLEEEKKKAGEFVKKDLYDGKAVAKSILNPVTDAASAMIGQEFETASVLGEKADSTVQSGGQMLATIGLQAVGVPWFVTTGATAFGAEAENALNQGATHEEAMGSAAISAAAEILTEKISGGIKFGGKALDDGLSTMLARSISNKLGRNALRLGIDFTGEAGEEVLSEIASNLGSALYRMDEESLQEILWSEEAFDGYLDAAIGGGMLGSVSGGFKAVSSTVKGKDYVSGLTNNEQKVVDAVYKKRLAEEQKNGKVDKSKLYDDVIRDMDKGYITTDEIESALGGGTYSLYKNTVDSEDAILKEYEELGKKTNATLAEQSRYAELTQQVKDIREKSQRDALKTQLDEEVFNLVKGDRLAESYNERARRGQAYQADLTKYDAKQQAVIQKAIDSGILNNTHRTHDFVDMVAKISADKGVLFDFTNNAKLKDSGFAVEGKQVNGYVTKDGITLNIDSKKAMETTVGHEITHVLEGTEFYDSLKQTIFEYAKAKGEYQSRYDSLTELYKDVKDADIEGELTADLVGEYLFSDTDFITNLSTQNRNVFQKIYDEIKYLCKVVTAGSKEARDLERVRKAFEDAYRAGGKAQSETKYSISDPFGDSFLDDSEVPWNTDESSGMELTEDQSSFISQLRTNTKVKALYDTLIKEQNKLADKYDATEYPGETDWNTFLDKITGDVANAEWNKNTRFDNLIASWAVYNWDMDLAYALDPDDKMSDRELRTKIDEITAAEQEALEKFGDAINQLYDQMHPKKQTTAEDRIQAEYAKLSDSEKMTVHLIQMGAVNPNNPGTNYISEKLDKFLDLAGLRNAVKYSLSDSAGRQLTKEQQEFFKDSKVRDENGNLKVMYHGTSKGGFTVFDTYKSKYGLFGTGFYFTDSENIGNSYTKKGKGNNPKVYEAYLNIKNPLDMDAVADPAQWAEAFDDVDFPESGTNEDFYRALEEYYADEQIAKWEVEDIIRESIEYGMGYDGITHIGGGRVNADGERHQVYIAFEPEQIKNIDNTKPTDNPDIRYSLSEVPLDQRLSGDDLLDAEDLIAEIEDVAEISANGYVTVYHRTTEENARKILQSGKMSAKEDGIFFSTQKDGEYSADYGKGVVELKVPVEKFVLDDIFDTEAHLRIPLKNRKEVLDVSGYLTGQDAKYSLTEQEAQETNDKLGNVGMYNNDGVGSPQMPVLPEFNMPYIQEMLDNYVGGHQAFPVAHDVVEKFVQGKKNGDFSLSNMGEAPVRPNYRATMGEDIALQTEDIAPVGVITSPTAEENSTVQQETQLTEDNSTLSETETVAPLPDSGEEVKQTRKQYHQSIIDRIRGTFKARGFDFDEVLKKAKNLSTWATVDNTPQRVMEKSLGYKEGGILADITVNKVAQNETEGIKWVNENVKLLKEISKQYHIKPGSKKSAAAQMYAEGFYVDKDNNIVQYGDRELAIDFPDPKVRANIKGLARDPRIRKIYDDTLASINESRTRNLYPEIPRLDNYFLHFRAMSDTFSTLGLPFNPNDIRAKDLPTDLNGVTADLKPGQPYFASAMHREGKRTSFDMLGGIERYLNSAKNQIYHIDDIQTLRALRNYIAETYGQATGLEDIDSMSDAEAEERIKQVYGAHLSTFAKFLNEEANVLAGKTALIDRGLEGIIGRRGITFLNALNQQVGSNMVGYNVSSSLTNFLPVAQTFAKTNKFDFVKAFTQTVANKVSGGRLDSFAEDSPVVIRRKGQDRFYQTPWQKMQNPGYALMGMVDDISTELIARTKYNELTRKGMDSQKAHFETDKWVSRLMGDRSLGQMPQLYNSKMLGLITKFQLEVRNQLDAQFYDTIQEKKASNEQIQNGLVRNTKTAAQVASTFAQLAVVQHLFGMAFESVAGYNPAFDIIEVLMTAFGYDDEEDSEDTALDNFAQGLLALAEDMPYASTFTGGRVPISEAIPDVNAILRGEDEYGNEIGIPQALVENAKEIAPYYLLPGGFGQAKKTVAGLKMFSDEHPIAGSYTDAGNLRYPVEDTLKNRIHAGIFGQYANENARKYFDQEQRTLNPEQTEILAGLDIPIEEYWEYRDELNKFKEVKDQMYEAANVDGATEEDALMYRYFGSVNSDLNKLYEQQKEIASGNSSDKQAKLRELQAQMSDILADSEYESDIPVSVSGKYAEVGNRRYNYDAEDGTWYEIKPKTSEGEDNRFYIQEKLSHDKLGISYSNFWNDRRTPSKNATYYAEYNGKRYNYDAEKSQWYEIRKKNDDGTDNWYYQREQEVTKGLGISYEEYWSKPKEYNYAYDKPGRYAISQAVGGYDAYMEYYDALENWQSDNYIASDKDEYGNTISGSRKPKVWDYIDGLGLDYGEKLILYRTVYSSKKDKNAYNMDIVNYLNDRKDLSYDQKKSILEELEMTVDDEGYIDW